MTRTVSHFSKPAPLNLAFGVSALLLASGCRDAAPPPAPPVPVVVAPVERRALPFELAATGTVEPIKTVTIQAQVSGVLERVAFREGDEVKAGQVLFQIDPRPYRATLAQAQAELARARAQAANAEQEAKRYAALVEKEYVTAQQYDEVRTNAAALQATLAASEAAVEEARLNLQYATIRAPISGRTGSLLVREGNLVRANTAAPLVTINQLRPILVRFAVPATNLSLIQQHRTRDLVVRVEPTAGSTKPSVGTLTFVDNAVDTLTGTILLKGLFPNTDGALWPGGFVNVRLELFVEPDALVVPVAALVSGQQGSYVFIIRQDRTARSTPVTVERTAGDLAVVRGELAAGDQVVTDGQLRLRPGAKVQIQAAGTTGPREAS